MILVDSQIKQLVAEGKLIKDGYKDENLNSISYDLTIDKIILSKENIEEIDSFSLKPGEFVYIKTKEILCIPDNILGRIVQKNSIMRMGLVVDGPHYQPGHTTKSFLRVQNISPHELKIENDKKIAQIIFEELAKIPDRTYNQQEDASFNNEFSYEGFGKYEAEYNKSIKKIEQLNESLDEKENKIYANIITFMGIFISVFSIITINFELFSQKNISAIELTKNMVIINLSLGLVITFLLSIITIIINKVIGKINIILTAIILGLLVFINIFFLISKNKPQINNYSIIESIIEGSDITVIRLQELLNNKGYNLEITGQLDKETYDAINKYKTENEITTNSLIQLIGELQ